MKASDFELHGPRVYFRAETGRFYVFVSFGNGDGVAKVDRNDFSSTGEAEAYKAGLAAAAERSDHQCDYNLVGPAEYLAAATF